MSLGGGITQSLGSRTGSSVTPENVYVTAQPEWIQEVIAGLVVAAVIAAVGMVTRALRRVPAAIARFAMRQRFSRLKRTIPRFVGPVIRRGNVLLADIGIGKVCISTRKDIEGRVASGLSVHLSEPGMGARSARLVINGACGNSIVSIPAHSGCTVEDTSNTDRWDSADEVRFALAVDK